MRKIILSVLTLGLISTSFAQVNNTEVKHCATAQKMHEFVQSLTPQQRIQYEQQRQAEEQFTQQYIQAHHAEIYSQDHQKSIQYTIPVVFHIIHEGGSGNISTAQIMDALQRMNDDYQELNADVSNTIPYFQSRVANVQVQFKLAKLDPNGNCTNGITRTFSHSTSTGNTQDQVQAVKNAQGNWPGDEYLNIFVAKNIGGAAGFTMYPNNFLGSSMSNGIHVLSTYTGTIGTADWRGMHTISHEAGHWLNLSHTWGDSNNPGLSDNCNDDDHVADTPNTIGWTTCDLQGKTCTSDTATYDNVQNIMDYSYCSTMFTEGQKARMWAALNSSTGNRNHIWSAANLAATGVNLPSTLCKADFDTQYKVVCEGEPVSFNDLSYSNVSGWNWTFQGASPATSTNQNPTVTYSSPGVYQVKLTVSDGSSSISKTKNAFIKVLGNPKMTPFVEGFENMTDLSTSDWGIDNPGNNAAFQLTSNAAYMGNKSIELKNFGQDPGNTDAVMSPPVDLSSANATDGASLTFRYAYRKRSSTNKEKVQIAFTKDCAKTWEVRYLLSGSSFGTGVETSSWTPSSQNDWVTVNVTNITPDFFVDNFRVKFTFLSDAGNNFFLDNINIYKGDPSQMGVIENEWVKGLRIYPNPTNSTANLAFSVPKAANANVTVTNLTGQTVLTHAVHVNSGKNLIILGTQKLDAGVYLVKLNVGGNLQTKRLIIK